MIEYKNRIYSLVLKAIKFYPNFEYLIQTLFIFAYTKRKPLYGDRNRLSNIAFWLVDMSSVRLYSLKVIDSLLLIDWQLIICVSLFLISSNSFLMSSCCLNFSIFPLSSILNFSICFISKSTLLSLLFNSISRVFILYVISCFVFSIFHTITLYFSDMIYYTSFNYFNFFFSTFITKSYLVIYYYSLLQFLQQYFEPAVLSFCCILIWKYIVCKNVCMFVCWLVLKFPM